MNIQMDSWVRKTSMMNTLLLMMMLFLSVQAFAKEELSEINTVLFDSQHMKNIVVPGKLHYDYKKFEPSKDLKTDSVDVNITNITTTKHTDQSYDFFTGVSKRPYLSREHLMGNGIFMLFLEWDIRELDRKTEGSWRYFQRRIRWAMAAGADKKEVEINYKGKKVKGVQYSIQPYVDDKKNTKYGIYANKYYLFTLSDEIPGAIYEVRTIVPKDKIWKEGDAVLVDESIRFGSFTPSKAL